MIRAIKRALVCVVVLVAATREVQAAELVGVTGDGAATPESLFVLDQTNASATFIMTLGNGNDGETIGFNPDDGLLYHASGRHDGNRFWESIDVNSATMIASGQFTGPDVREETLAMTYNPASGTFLVADLGNDFFDTTLAGVATKIGTTPLNLKGLAFVGSTLYGAILGPSGGNAFLYTLDPSNGSKLTEMIVTLDGAPVRGMNGLATNPDTGELWGIFYHQIRGPRTLGILDPSTGNATSVGILPDKFAGIAFLAASEPIAVTIDIKPGSYPNSINLKSKGLVPVAILSSDTFDAAIVDANTVKLAGAGVAIKGRGSNLMARLEDVNEDGLLDLVCHIITDNLDPNAFTDGFACLTGATFDGTSVEGWDEIRIVPTK